MNANSINNYDPNLDNFCKMPIGDNEAPFSFFIKTVFNFFTQPTDEKNEDSNTYEVEMKSDLTYGLSGGAKRFIRTLIGYYRAYANLKNGNDDNWPKLDLDGISSPDMLKEAKASFEHIANSPLCLINNAPEEFKEVNSLESDRNLMFIFLQLAFKYYELAEDKNEALSFIRRSFGIANYKNTGDFSLNGNDYAVEHYKSDGVDVYAKNAKLVRDLFESKFDDNDLRQRKFLELIRNIKTGNENATLLDKILYFCDVFGGLHNTLFDLKQVLNLFYENAKSDEGKIFYTHHDGYALINYTDGIKKLYEKSLKDSDEGQRNKCAELHKDYFKKLNMEYEFDCNNILRKYNYARMLLNTRFINESNDHQLKKKKKTASK